MPCAGTLECMTHSRDTWRQRTAHASTGNKCAKGAATGQFAGHAPAWELLNRINPDSMAEARYSGAGAGALHMPAQAKIVLTGPQGDNSQGTLLHGGSAAVTDEYGATWVASQW